MKINRGNLLALNKKNQGNTIKTNNYYMSESPDKYSSNHSITTIQS